MRENKFQAWIPDIERMYQVISVDVEPRQNGRQKLVKVWEHPCVKTAIIKGKVGVFQIRDGVVIRQYVGLKDKNGVEIYEGDIVSFHKEGFEAMEVFWDIDTNGFICATSRIAEDGSASCIDERCEVIGNIYQNPELLEGDT